MKRKKTVRKTTKFVALFMQGDIKNRNGRIYPKDVLMKEVGNYNRKLLMRIGHLVS